MSGPTEKSGPIILADSLPVSLLRVTGQHCKAFINYGVSASHDMVKHMEYELADGPEPFCRESLRRFMRRYPAAQGYVTPTSVGT